MFISHRTDDRKHNPGAYALRAAFIALGVIALAGCAKKESAPTTSSTSSTASAAQATKSAAATTSAKATSATSSAHSASKKDAD